MVFKCLSASENVMFNLSLFLKVALAVLLFFGLLLLPMTLVLSTDGRDQWQQLDTVDGVALFRPVEEPDDLVPFRAIAVLDIPYQKIVMALVDTERKNSWAPKLKSVTMHQEITTNSFEYSEYYAAPWPFFDREFLLVGTVEYMNDRVLLRARNSTNRHLADRGHLLASVKKLEMVITPLSAGKTEVAFTFSGDIGGLIPDFVKNIIQKKWPVQFINAMKRYITNTSVLETPRYFSLKKHALVITKKP